MNLLPVAITAAGAIPSIIGGIMNAVLAGKKLTGGRLHRKRLHKKGKGLVNNHKRRQRRHKRKGKGVVADTLGSVPLLGAILGPLAKVFGGKLKRMPKKHRRAAVMALARKLHGKGLSPMYIRRPYVSSGCGLSPMYIRRPYSGGRLAPIGADKGLQNTYLTPSMANFALGMPPYVPPLKITAAKTIAKPRTGYHLRPDVSILDNTLPQAASSMYPETIVRKLMPIGGEIYRKGHLRKIKGRKQKIRVKPAVIGRGLLYPAGRGLLAPAGGYIPYGGNYGVYRCN